MVRSRKGISRVPTLCSPCWRVILPENVPGLCWCEGDLYGFAFAGAYGQCGWLHCDAFRSRVSGDFEGTGAGVFDFRFYGFGLPYFKGSAKVDL